MSAIANEIPMEPSIDALDVAPAVAPVDAPMDASINVEAESNAAAGDGPATPRRDRSSLLKSLEDSTTAFLGEDVALFAAFDQDESPRLTRAQTRKRRSGAPPTPPKEVKSKRGRKSGAKKAAQPAATDEAGDRVDDAAENAVNDTANDAAGEAMENVVIDPVEGENPVVNAAVDMMERGELPSEKDEENAEAPLADDGKMAVQKDASEVEAPIEEEMQFDTPPEAAEEPKPEDAEDGEIVDAI